MIEVASKKLGLDHVVLDYESTASESKESKKKKGKLDAKKIENLLKYGTLFLYEEEQEKLAENLIDEDIDSILKEKCIVIDHQHSKKNLPIQHEHHPHQQQEEKKENFFFTQSENKKKKILIDEKNLIDPEKDGMIDGEDEEDDIVEDENIKKNNFLHNLKFVDDSKKEGAEDYLKGKEDKEENQNDNEKEKKENNSFTLPLTLASPPPPPSSSSPSSRLGIFKKTTFNIQNTSSISIDDQDFWYPFFFKNIFTLFFF